MASRSSVVADDSIGKWKNRTRVLVFCSRGASYRDRHLMNDLKSLMPHSKSENKMDKRESIGSINEMCDMKNCSKCLYFENRKKKDLYLWMANSPGGPSVKFLVENVHTMLELKLTGNCLKGSRPLLSFDADFSKEPHLKLCRELLVQIFSVPDNHPRSKPFVDRIIAFSWHDDRIWFRHYQIVDPDNGALEEIGPRMTLWPIIIQAGSFGGSIIYKNSNYVSPNLVRRKQRLALAGKSMTKLASKISMKNRRQKEPLSFSTDPLDDVYLENHEQTIADDAHDDSELKRLNSEISRKRKKKINKAVMRRKEKEGKKAEGNS